MISILIILISFFSAQQSTPVTEIHFGHGGGFTGSVTSYALHKDGSLYKVNVFSGEKSLHCNIDLKTTTSIFQKIDLYELSDFTYNEPGNTYKFIHLIMAEREHRIVWSGKSANKNLNLFYAELKALCNSN